MSKHLSYHERHNKGCWGGNPDTPVATGESDLRELAARVRELAGERGVKVPDRIGGGGAHCTYFYINWTSLAMKDIIQEAAEELGFKPY